MQLGDFGISQLYESKANSVSGTESGAGCAPYMAIELLDGEPYTNKVDVWSTGCVLFEMSNLKAMWYNAPEHHVFRQAIPFIVARNIEAGNHEKFDQDSPQEIKELVLKATKTNPKERLTAQELYDQAKAIKSRL